jgi:hypothetical protein
MLSNTGSQGFTGSFWVLIMGVEQDDMVQKMMLLIQEDTDVP